jgi:predicted nucleic-acid-binding Zn-ribbon protein
MGLFKKEAKRPENIFIKGNQLKCRICDNTTFHKRNAQLNTAALSFLDLDWANKSATCYVCSKCTHIEWFLEEN